MKTTVNLKKVCCKVVKQYFAQHNHTSCNRGRNGNIYKGAELNVYFNNKPFIANEEYFCCFNLDCCLKRNTIPKANPLLHLAPAVQAPSMTSINEVERPEFNPQTERDVRKLINELKKAEGKIQELKKENDILRSTLDEYYEYFVEEIEQMSTPGHAQKKARYTHTLQQKLIEGYDKYNYAVPLHKLMERGRKERVNEIIIHILCACLSRRKVKEVPKYYLENEYVMSNISSCLNIIKHELELKMNQNLIERPSSLASDNEVLEQIKETKDVVTLCNTDIAVALLKETTGQGYDRIRKGINELLLFIGIDRIPNAKKALNDFSLPVEAVDIEVEVGGGGGNKENKNLDRKKNMMFGRPVEKKENECVLSLFEKTSRFIDSSGTKIKLLGAKLKGGYDYYCQVLIDKIVKNFPDLKEDDQLIFINSWDGAEASRSKKKTLSIICFSVMLLIPRLINTRVLQAGASENVLTWMLLSGKEELIILLAATKEYFVERNKVRSGDVSFKNVPHKSKVWVYDMHDASLWYTLLQCSKWNRKLHRFSSCTCRNGEGVSNSSNHICHLFGFDEYVQLFMTSLRRFMNTNSSEDEHRKWCDMHNKGVTHFGIDPELFDVNDIRYDVFHGMCAVIRQVMWALREFFNSERPGLREKFTSEILLTFWNDFLCSEFNNKMSFGKFQGNELKKFVDNVERICYFIETNSADNKKGRSIRKLLTLLGRIDRFVKITYINVSDDKYEQMMKEFDEDVKKIYKYSRLMRIVSSDDEIFYFHCLRYYFPQIARINFERHRLGLGIFSMQAIERRNKQCKSIFQKFCTLNWQCASFLINNLKRLALIFLHK